MKIKKGELIFNIVAVIVFVTIVYFLFIPKSVVETNEGIAKCIGERSTVYVQTGCSHCEDQLAMFQNYTSYLNQIDCAYTPEKCSGIEGTPTWKISNKLYVGVQSIDTLKSLTGC